MRSHRRRSNGTRFAVVGAVITLVLVVVVAVVKVSQQDAVRGPTWGMAGSYTTAQLHDLRGRGVDAVLVEMSWAAANPARDRFDQPYLDGIAAQVSRDQAAGYQVILNYGLQDAPRWVLDQPSGRYVDQDGNPDLTDMLPDLVFNLAIRPFARRYTDLVMTRLGSQVSIVRAGGGLLGELRYPAGASASGLPAYWAYSKAAQAHAPDPGWRPCTHSPHGEAGRFLSWYLHALVNFQTWQVATLRRHYSGLIAMLYPSAGVTTTDRAEATTDHLCAHTPADRAGALAAGYDHADQIAALAGPALAVWGTSVNNTANIAALAQLAAAHHLPVAGENTGGNDAADLRRSVANARRYHLLVFLWIRASEAYCRCHGLATIEQYQHVIAAAVQPPTSDGSPSAGP